MPRSVTGVGLTVLLVTMQAVMAAHSGTVLLSQEYEYYVLGSREATSTGVAPICHVATYRGFPLSVGGVCLPVPANATEVGVRVQSGGLEATDAYYEFRDAGGDALGQGRLCKTASLSVPAGAVRLIVSLDAFSLSPDCPDPRPATVGFVGADYHAPG